MLVINLLYLFEKNKPCFIHSSDGYTCLVVPINNVHWIFSLFIYENAIFLNVCALGYIWM